MEHRRLAHPTPGASPSKESSDLRCVADITELGCKAGKLHLAAIRDVRDHSVVGWSLGERQTTDLVVAPLVVALGRREPTSALVHHADHSNQPGAPRSSSPTGLPTES